MDQFLKLSRGHGHETCEDNLARFRDHKPSKLRVFKLSHYLQSTRDILKSLKVLTREPFFLRSPETVLN